MTPVGVVQGRLLFGGGLLVTPVAPAVGTRASEPSSALTNRIDKVLVEPYRWIG
jgi:hypothetical protein